MVDPVRLREMIALRSFEQGRGREALRASRYFRSDYIGLQLIRTFFLTAIADVLIVALYVAGNAEELLNRLVRISFLRLGAGLLIGFIVSEAVFLGLTYVLYSRKYRRGRRMMSDYELHLTDLREQTERTAEEN